MNKKIKEYHKNTKFVKITREVAKDVTEISSGYIVDYSNDFVLLQESDDFRLLGFSIFPITDFKKVRHNKYDKYYDKIMSKEGEKKNIGIKTKVDLTDWKSIFKSLQKKNKNVIVECEHPDINTFTIGPIKRVNNKSVAIQYFDATGIIDEEPYKISYKNISRVLFDDRYVDTFSKYTRKKK